MASFNDSRCAAGGVCPTDPLFFTCELIEVMLLQVVLPNGFHEYVGLGDTATNIDLPDGLTAVFLNITETKGFKINIVLTLSIASASLLEGGELGCYDSLGNGVMAGCPLRSKPQQCTINPKYVKVNCKVCKTLYYVVR